MRTATIRFPFRARQTCSTGRGGLRAPIRRPPPHRCPLRPMARLVLSRLAWFLLAATWAIASTAELLLIGGPTMGTTYHVKLVGATAADEAGSPAGAQA